jgi:Alpha galactosidase A
VATCALCNLSHTSTASVNWEDVINAGCNQFRVSVDIDCNSASLFRVIDFFGTNGVDMAPIHGPGHFMDADQLIIGNNCISHDEEATQMALWAVMAQPLIVSTDFRNITASSAAILLSESAIAIDQDALGIMGLRLENSSLAPTQRWAKPLLGGDVAVVLLNRHGGSAPCPAWNETDNGYPECCGGCCTGFTNLTVAEAEAQCCGNEDCAGFSISASGDGCFKSAPDCGFVNSTQYRGFFKENWPPPTPPPADIEILFADVDLFGPVRVYDVFAETVIGVFHTSYTAMWVPFHGSAFLRLSKA